MLELLQSIRKAVTPVAFDVYDQAEEESLLPVLATVIDNRTLMEDPVNLEWVGEFFEMREWLDEKTIQKVFKGEFTIPIQAYEVTIGLDQKKIRRPNALGGQLARFERMARAFSRGKKKLVMDVLRSNPLAYDGQNLFDTDHTHPGDKGTYSNVLAPAFVNKDAPTIDDLKTALHAAFNRLFENGAILEEVVDASVYDRDFVVIAHRESYWTKLNQIRTQARIDDKENELVGSFQLLRDMSPASGQESYFEVAYAPSGGPRPVLFVVDEEPTSLKVDETSVFKNRKVAMGLEGYYGAKPGWPQVITQTRATTA